MIYINFLQYIWRKNSEFLYNFWNLIIAHNGEVSPGFPVFCLFVFIFVFVFVCHLCRFFWTICPRVYGDGAFSWGFPRWEIEWNFCNFCILCSGCHYLLYFISLFIYCYCYYCYYYFWLALIRHICFCWCELL